LARRCLKNKTNQSEGERGEEKDEKKLLRGAKEALGEGYKRTMKRRKGKVWKSFVQTEGKRKV